mgnify:FL=1
MDIHNCTICPRNCGADRTSETLGYCGIDARPHIAEICLHKGEEPVLGGKNGVCNVFFSSCNLRCVYCQNYAISQQKPEKKEIISIQRAAELIAGIMCKYDVDTVGFVSPSHQVFQMVAIIDLLHKRGFFPTIVYNSNGYDSPETLRVIKDYVDVYLPDFKYFDGLIAQKYSSANNYPKVALAALKEMYWQKGATIITDDNEIARSGLIIRHLVLPNYVENSLKVLETLADEISPRVHVSLMSQYYPEYKALEINNLNRTITIAEYQAVKQAATQLGIVRGWFQDMASNAEYRPDFSSKDVFKG